MFCKNCGRELPDEAEFCGNCGTKTTGALQTENEFQQSKKEERKETSKALLMGLGGLALLVVCGFILYHAFIKDLIQMGKEGVQWVSEKIQENSQKTTSNSSSNTQQNQKNQPVSSVGNLRNTTWQHFSTYSDQEIVGGGLQNLGSAGWVYDVGTPVEVTRAKEQVIDFGNGNFNWQVLQGSGHNRTGTYSVSGDMVYFTFSDGFETRAQLIGNSLSFSDMSFRRIE